jgi:hypothetical protein
MTSHWFAGATALALMTGSALAQSPALDATNSTEPTMSTTGPAETYDMTKTRRTMDARGVETDTTETFDKSQTYSSGDGQLSAKTSVKTTGSTTVTTPAAPVSTTTSTTTQEIRR